MKVLYINNFRGFENTFIPICNVNFLVGENSTGKTSVLSLLKLTSSNQFWATDDFNLNEIELGFFSELISNNTRNKRYFEIGFANNESNGIYKYLLARYFNNNGEPFLKELRVLVQDKSLSINFSNGGFRMKVQSFVSNTNGLEEFKEWIGQKDFSRIKNTYTYDRDELIERRSYVDIKYKLKKLFPSMKIEGSGRPSFLPYITWIAPIRSKPKRIYESFKLSFSSEGSHTPLVIKNILSNHHGKDISKMAFLKSIQRFGRQSGLFDKIEVKNYSDDSVSPFILNIYLNKKPQKITNVGYGVGQVLPLLTEIIISERNRWLSIQQPEVHLHPKAQAALGEFIFKSALSKNQNFLIETHSDFVIDRFRSCLKASQKKQSDRKSVV